MLGAASGYLENISTVRCEGKQEGGNRIKEQDSLTGLYNMQAARKKIMELLDEEKVQNGLLFYIDLDDFREINDTYGYPAGDELLQAMGELLLETAHKEDVAARIGGDEFLLFLVNVPDGRAAYYQALQLYGTCMAAGGTSPVSVSMGIACYPQDGRFYEELAARADEALYASKHLGKQCFLFYEDLSKL